MPSFARHASYRQWLDRITLSDTTWLIWWQAGFHLEKCWDMGVRVRGLENPSVFFFSRATFQQYFLPRLFSVRKWCIFHCQKSLAQSTLAQSNGESKGRHAGVLPTWTRVLNNTKKKIRKMMTIPGISWAHWKWEENSIFVTGKKDHAGAAPGGRMAPGVWASPAYNTFFSPLWCTHLYCRV